MLQSGRRGGWADSSSAFARLCVLAMSRHVVWRRSRPSRRSTVPSLMDAPTPYDSKTFTCGGVSHWCRLGGGLMDPVSIGTTARMASAVARPIIARLLVKEDQGVGACRPTGVGIERLLPAAGVVAEEAPDLKLDRGLLPGDRGVGEPAGVAVVHSR